MSSPLVSMLKRVSLSAPLQFVAMDESSGGPDTPPAADAICMCSAASGNCSGSTSFSSISASVGFAQPLGELGSAVPDAAEEEAVRQCFCDAYEMEVQHLQQCGRPLPDLDQQQQILADLLVWAEVTQRHYDQQTQSFVVQPHMSDSGFARLGEFYKAAKAKHGLQ